MDLLNRTFLDKLSGDHFKTITVAEDEPGVIEIHDGENAEDVRDQTESNDAWISVTALRERIANGSVEEVF